MATRRWVAVAAAVIVAGMVNGAAVGSVSASDGAPQVGECMNARSLNSMVLPSGPVDCQGAHTGQTVHVGRWRSSVSPAEADDLDAKAKERLRRQLEPEYQACRAALDDLVGRVYGKFTRKASVFREYMTGPNAEQWDGGQRWLRCDVVAERPPVNFKPATGALMKLPPPERLAGFLRQRAGDWDQYSFCVAENPKDEYYYWIDCARSILWGVAFVNPEGTYPGSQDAAFKQMRQQCMRVLPKITGQKYTPSNYWVLSYTSEEAQRRAYKKSLWLCGLNLSG